MKVGDLARCTFKGLRDRDNHKEATLWWFYRALSNPPRTICSEGFGSSRKKH